MKFIKHIWFLLIGLNFDIYSHKTPKLTVVIVIDQFGSQYLQKLKPYLRGGLKFLLKNGLNYNYAIFPQSKPCTSAGHVLLSTGTFAQYHGIVNNKWWDSEGNQINDDDDNSKNSLVFSPTGTYDFGKSAKNILSDGLSDQLMLHSYPTAQNKVWALSLKSRASIGVAGKLGKAIWFDGKSGNFTSSKYYFDKLPDWVTDFNNKSNIGKLKSYIWRPKYRLSGSCYNYKYSHDYKFSSKKTQFNRTKNIKHDKDSPYTGFMRTPTASKELFNLAKACVNFESNDRKNKDKILLWVSLSGLDKIGHKFGPYSAEALDMVYHIDNQLLDFMQFCYKKFSRQETLFVLTGDHGVEAIPQLVQEDKLDISRKYVASDLISTINDFVKSKYKTDKFIHHFNQPSLYCDKKFIESLDKETKKKLFKDVKRFILGIPGIRKVWTYKELSNAHFDTTYDLDIYLQRQLFKGRSGELLISTMPYTSIQSKESGTGHMTSYNYDTQVSLIFYLPNRLHKKTIFETVYMSQLAPTLASILKTPRPSASIAPILPGIVL